MRLAKGAPFGDSLANMSMLVKSSSQTQKNCSLWTLEVSPPNHPRSMQHGWTSYAFNIGSFRKSCREGVANLRIQVRKLGTLLNSAVATSWTGPEGPSTQYLRSLVPKTILLMEFGTRDLEYWVFGPSVRYIIPCHSRRTLGLRWPLLKGSFHQCRNSMEPPQAHNSHKGYVYVYVYVCNHNDIHSFLYFNFILEPKGLQDVHESDLGAREPRSGLPI